MFSKFTHMQHGLTDKQQGLLLNGKQINWINLKRRSLLVHKEIKIKINRMFSVLCKLGV